MAMPCFHRIFDQRLDEESGDFAGVAIGVDIADEAEAFAEARLLHAQIHIGQSDFFRERDGVALAEAQRGAQEIGQADAHLPARAGSTEVRALMEFRLLKRKWGLICALRAFS